MSATVKQLPKFKDGERVRIVAREPGAPDPKAVTYYSFYGNLSGTIIKAYDDLTVALDVDRGSLPDEVRQRHEVSEGGMREKWLGGLGEEELNRLPEKHKQFTLRYTLIVSENDLIIDNSPPPKIKRTPVAAPKAIESTPAPKAIAAPVTEPTIEEPKRKTPEELEADEAAHFEEIRQQKAQ